MPGFVLIVTFDVPQPGREPDAVTECYGPFQRE